MATYAEKLAALTARHREEQTALGQQQAILEALPPDLCQRESFIHIHTLYDRGASLQFKTEQYESLRKYPPITLADVRLMASAFPPLDAALYRDGCVGVRTLENANAACTVAETRNPETSATVTPIAPCQVRIDPSSYASTATIEWITEIAGIRADVRFVFSLFGEVGRRIGTSIVRREYSAYTNRTGMETQILENSFRVAPAVSYLGNAKGMLLKYGSGSSTTPGQHLLYWDSGNGEPAETTIADLCDALERE